MWTELLTGFVGLVLMLISVIYLHRKYKHGLLKKMGIPGPTPHWLFGNLFHMKSSPLYELVPQWTKKYGKIWGYYEGPTPIVVTSDVELLQEIFVKQFSNFFGRKLFPAMENPDTAKGVNVFFARGQRWKRLRSTMNPTFTESRMRQMFPLVDNCIQRMLQNVNQAAMKSTDSDVDIYKYFQLLTLETICECAFGVELNTQSNPNNEVIENLRAIFNQDRRQMPIMITGMVFPELSHILGKLLIKLRSKSSPMTKLQELVKDVVKNRRDALKSGKAPTRIDLLQLLLDAEVDSTTTDQDVTPTNNIDDVDIQVSSGQCPVAHHGGSKSSSAPPHGDKNKRLSEEEVIAQAVLFLFAGYETTSTALGYCAYDLVQNSNVLDRLVDEIDSAMQDLSKEDKTLGSVNFYKAICHLPYLEAVIWETLRYHPFVNTAINRRVMTSSAQLGNITLPEGTVVAPDGYTVHFNEDLWGPIDVNKFDPDRHLKLKENGKYEFAPHEHAMAMLAFGTGPKNCIGQRFALMEMRATLVRLLMNFTIEKGSKTPDILPLRMGGTVSPRDGVWLKLRPRAQ